jgi:hypothetical protein
VLAAIYLKHYSTLLFSEIPGITFYQIVILLPTLYETQISRNCKFAGLCKFPRKELDKKEIKREGHSREYYVYINVIRKLKNFFKLKMLLNKKYRRTQKVACQGERRTAFKL